MDADADGEEDEETADLNDMPSGKTAGHQCFSLIPDESGSLTPSSIVGISI